MTVLATLPIARVSTADLLSAVTDASKGIGSRPTVPVLGGVRLHQLDNGLLEVAGFNYETAITRRVHVDGELPDVLVAAAIFRTALKNLNSKQPVTLSVDGGRFVITQGRKRVALDPLDLDDYPQLPPVPKQRNFTIAGEHLDFIGSKVAVFAGRDDHLPVLTGVHFTLGGGVLSVAATDRFRLAAAEFGVRMSVKDKQEDVEFLLPSTPLIGSLFKKHATVAVSVEGEDFAKRVTFHTDDTTVSVRSIEGQFPKVRSLFPAETVTTAVLDPQVFLQAIKFAETGIERNTPVRLTVGDNQVQVAGRSGEDVFSDTVDAAVAGDEVEMGFNPSYLTDALKVWGKGHAVTIGITQPARPAVFTSPAAENLRVLLMPVRLSS